jgi:hypothetical protein
MQRTIILVMTMIITISAWSVYYKTIREGELVTLDKRIIKGLYIQDNGQMMAKNMYIQMTKDAEDNKTAAVTFTTSPKLIKEIIPDTITKYDAIIKLRNLTLYQVEYIKKEFPLIDLDMDIETIERK